MESDRRGFLRMTREKSPIPCIPYEVSSESCKFFKATLRVECDRADGSDTFPYLMFQELFPVTHPIVERAEVKDWAISLAFPLKERASGHDVGDVFSFLPTELRTGFPFIINADFILTSSRESIRFDSVWNIGILHCIPLAFRTAFMTMLLTSRACSSNVNDWYLSIPKDAQKFLPVNSIENANRYSSAGSTEKRQLRQKLPRQASTIYQMEKVRAEVFHIVGEQRQASTIHQMEKVRAEIFHTVGEQKFIFLSSPGMDKGSKLSREYGLPAESCLRINTKFREVLERCPELAPGCFSRIYTWKRMMQKWAFPQLF